MRVNSIFRRNFIAAGVSIMPLLLSAQNIETAIRLTKNEEFQRADVAFKNLIKANPADGKLYFYEGENFFKWDFQDSAAAAYRKGILKNPAEPLNYAGLGKIELYADSVKEAQHNFEYAKVLSKSKDPIVLSKIAVAYINVPNANKDITKAIQLLTAAINLDPNNADICIDMGDAYLALNDGSNAVTYYDKATSINPKSVTGLLRLGQLYSRARNYDLSYQYYQKATQTDSTFAPAYREKAEMLNKSERYDEAVAQYKKYLQLNNSLDARIRYAEFLYEAKKYKESVTEIQTILPKDSSNLILYRVMAYSLYETGDYKNGLIYINKFFEKDSKGAVKILPSDYAYQGKLLSRNGQDSLAVEKMKQAMAKDSSLAAELTSQIGNIEYKDGKYDEAVKYFQMRTQLPQPTVNDYNTLGRAAYSNKQYGKADSAFAVITKYMPNLPLGYLWRARSILFIDTTQCSSKPYYELYAKKLGADTLKNKDNLIEAYSSVAYCFFINKVKDSASYYYNKVKMLDPNNPQQKIYFDSLRQPKSPIRKEGGK